VRGETGLASSGGVTIWYEDIAPAGDARGTVLLNASMAADALTWPPSFLRALTGAGYRVIRHDYRGTGLSDWMRKWDKKHPYTLADMANDAIAVLNERGVERAHIIGLSFGGMVAQELALGHPGRVLSLTLMSTSGHPGDPSLPSLTSGYLLKSLVGGLPALKYRILGGEKNLIRERIARMIAAGVEVNTRETAELVLHDLRERNGINAKALFQHLAASHASGSRHDRLRALRVPTMIVHGTEDKVFPIEHGRKLAELMPGAETVWLEGAGHMLPYPAMSDVEKRIIAHLEKQGASHVDQGP
jgi:pimeloyl-ACP methyl ester carboxylesterase